VTTALDRVDAAAWSRLPFPERQSVSSWLDANRVIPLEYPSPFKGPWRTERTPYLREPLDAFDNPEVETLVLMFASQIAKTELILGTLLYAYSVDAGPGLFVMPTLDEAAKFSTRRLGHALATCEGLDEGPVASRNTDDTKHSKSIRGYPLGLVGSNSAPGLAAQSILYLWADELDKWVSVIPNAGEPLGLAIQRTAAYVRRKIVLTSTPTVKSASRIESWYLRSDQRRYWVPCPRCGEAFVMKWENVRWDRGEDGTHYPDTAYLVHGPRKGEPYGCGGRIEDHERRAMVDAGEWRADNPDAPGRVRGYHANFLVCPWMALAKVVGEFVEKRKDNEQLRQFVNERLAETWEEPSLKGTESAALLDRREVYPAEVPAGVRILTAGVDTQDDRLEVLVMGWGVGEEGWVISRETIPGDPDGEEPWTELDALLKRGWRHERGGSHWVQATLVDSRGHRTGSVYRALKTRQARRVYASIGTKGGTNGQLVTEPQALATVHGQILRCVVGADEVKSLIYSRLALEREDGLPLREGPGVLHFPMDLSHVFFDELTSEHLVTKAKRGALPARVWEVRAGRTRNEALDCMGMAIAALRAVCPNVSRFEAMAEKVEAARVSSMGARPEGAPAAPPAPRPPRTRGWQG
jgi:phage terminase large subunit GpA-like protein